MLWKQASDPTTSQLITSFEEADLSAWTGGSIDDTGKQFVSSPVLDGTQALEIASFESGMFSLPGDGLGAYPQKGDVFQFPIRVSGGDSVSQLWFAVGDSSNHYFIEVDTPDGKIRLRENDGGSTITLENTSVTYAQDTWYAPRITWDDGTRGGENNDITLELIEDPFGSPTTLATLGPTNQGDPPAAFGRGVGINAKEFAGGSVAYYDYWQIEPGAEP